MEEEYTSEDRDRDIESSARRKGDCHWYLAKIRTAPTAQSRAYYRQRFTAVGLAYRAAAQRVIAFDDAQECRDA